MKKPILPLVLVASHALVAIVAVLILSCWLKNYVHSLPERVTEAAEEVTQGQPYCYVLPYLVNQQPERLEDGSTTIYMPAQYFSPFPAIIRKLTLDKDQAKWEKRGDRITPMHFGIISQGLSYQWSFKKGEFVLSNSFNHYGDFTKTQNLPAECLMYSLADKNLRDYGYRRDGDRIIGLVTELSTENTLENFNLDALEIIDYHLIKDDKNVYLLGEIIPDADPNSFEVVNNRVKNHYFINKDASHVYYNHQKIKGVDPNNFEVPHLSRYLITPDAVYFLGGNFIEPEIIQLEDVDPENFTLMEEHNFAQSGDNIYLEGMLQ